MLLLCVAPFIEALLLQSLILLCVDAASENVCPVYRTALTRGLAALLLCLGKTRPPIRELRHAELDPQDSSSRRPGTSQPSQEHAADGGSSGGNGNGNNSIDGSGNGDGSGVVNGDSRADWASGKEQEALHEGTANLSPYESFVQLGRSWQEVTVSVLVDILILTIDVVPIIMCLAHRRSVYPYETGWAAASIVDGYL